MQLVYSNVSKVMVESRNGSNLLYLPLDRLLQQSGVPAAIPAATTSQPSEPAPATDARARESRSRDRDSR
jgi:membrane protease subunit HflK